MLHLINFPGYSFDVRCFETLANEINGIPLILLDTGLFPKQYNDSVIKYEAKGVKFLKKDWKEISIESNI